MSRQTELSEDRERIRVVAGILCNAHRQILITDRLRASSMQHLWEFPGGKIENGESADAALNRELFEELGVAVRESAFFQTLKHDYTDLRVCIDFFIVSAWDGTPTGQEGQQLRWINEDELDAGMLLAADAPVVAALAARREENNER